MHEVVAMWKTGTFYGVRLLIKTRLEGQYDDRGRDAGDRLEKEVVELEYISSLVDRFNKVKGEEQKLKILFESTARCDGLTQQIAEYNCELM